MDIDLDPRELDVQDQDTGYRVVNLRYPPVRVVIFVQTAYDAGLHLPGLNRGELVCGPETRSFGVKGLHDREFTFKRTQVPLLPGHLSSVYRAQVWDFVTPFFLRRAIFRGLVINQKHTTTTLV